MEGQGLCTFQQLRTGTTKKILIACFNRLKEIDTFPKHFPGQKISPYLAEGDLIEIILVNMAPVQWRKSMVYVNFEHIQKTRTTVIEYLGSLKRWMLLKRKSTLRKRTRISQKIRLNQNLKVIGPAEMEQKV